MMGPVLHENHRQDTSLQAALYRRWGHVRALDLGSGPVPHEGYHGIDLCADNDRVLSFHLSHGKPWPFADGSIEKLRSSHFIEHVEMRDVLAHEFVEADQSPATLAAFAKGEVHSLYHHAKEPTVWARPMGRQDALCWVMDESYRVAVPGAEFDLRWPALINEMTGQVNAIAFMDPTHRRWIPKELLWYFHRQGRQRLNVEQYAIRCNWELVSLAQADLGMGVEYRALLRKPLTET